MKRFAVALIGVGMALSIVPTASAAEYAELTNIRTGKHATFDRVVFDLNGGQPQDSISELAQRAYYLTNPNRYVVDIDHADSASVGTANFHDYN